MKQQNYFFVTILQFLCIAVIWISEVNVLNCQKKILMVLKVDCFLYAKYTVISHFEVKCVIPSFIGISA